MRESRKLNICNFFLALNAFLLVTFTSTFLLTATPAAAAEQAKASAPQEPLPADTQVEESTLQQITDRTSIVFNLNAFYTYSDEVDGDSLSGGGLDAQLGLGTRMTDRSLFLVMYNGNYNKTLEYYSDLVGPRQRNEYQGHTITPALQFDFGANKQYSLSPSLFFTATYNKDVEGGGWDDGLYNYKDKGLGLDFKAKDMGYGGNKGNLILSIQYYEREYPNYESLLDLATGIGIEEDERDYDGVLGRLGYRWGGATGFSSSFDYYLLYKKLKGKKVVDSNGVLTGEGQKDYNNNLDVGLWFVPDTQPGLRLGVILNGSWYRSNQNYYDGLGTPVLDDDVFMADFYDFDSYGIRPFISYQLPMMPVTVTFSYAYQKTDYRGRLAQASDGSYRDKKQEEEQDSARVRLFYDLTEVLHIASRRQLGIYGQYHYLKVRSNNVNETVYSYNHEVHEYTAGLSLRY